MSVSQVAANLNSNILSSQLSLIPNAKSYWVAYSGGVDSHVLLHFLSSNSEQLGGIPLGAVHIDHQLQPESSAWLEHCQSVSDQLGLPFVSFKINIATGQGESPEAAARDARYQALQDWLPKAAALLTAQHQDDQAETLLLQLLRGAGSKGLAGMPTQIEFGNGLLVRPFLEISRETILAYAREQKLNWIEDPSNTDTRFDRNFLRHTVVPQLQKRWPSLSVTLSRAARHQAGQAELNTALGEIDLQRCEAGTGLSVNRLLILTQVRQRNLLRFWIQQCDLPVPADKILQRVLDESLNCQPDASPLVQWQGAEIRRYRDLLFAMSPLPRMECEQHHEWKPGQVLQLECPAGVLSSETQTGKGLHGRFLEQSLEIRFRQGGEVLQPVARGQTHALKKLLQDKGIPGWERERLPLLYADGKLVAVPDICICEGCQTEQDKPGYLPHWSRLEAYL